MLKKELLNFLNKNDYDYLLVNSTNEFLVEYNDLQCNSRYHLTGFSGSAGDALISRSGEIFLFVDGRYHKQAENQAFEGVNVIKLALGETFLSALISTVKSNCSLAIVSNKISLNFYKNLSKYLYEKKLKLVKLDFDPVSNLVGDAQCAEPAIITISEEIAGKSSDKKISEIQKKLKQDEALLVTNLEEIAYMTNKRAFAQNFSSSFKAKMIIEKNSSKLFLQSELDEFYNYLNNLSKTIIFSAKSINLKDYNLIKSHSKEAKTNWIEQKKAVKNKSEIKHLKNCFQKTDTVLKKVSDYIDNAKNLTEQELSVLVEKEFFTQGATSLGFNVILASGKNSALAHYSTDINVVTPITKGSMILLDCGAYFEGGYSTDITRVFCFGEPETKQKELYTTVLRAFLNAYNIKTSKNLSGYDIDKKARAVITAAKMQGFSFNHATGHGIGICVHEFPPSISMAELAKSPLKSGMTFTIEPGLYNPDFAGVRLENSVYFSKQKGEYVIKSFSKMKFEEKLIDYAMLNSKELKWLEKWQRGDV